MNTIVRTETPADEPAIDRLHRAAFAGDAEANLVAALRSGGFVDGSFVAIVNEEIVGHVLFSRVTIRRKDGRALTASSLAPMAVFPEYQRRGVGSHLLTSALQTLQESQNAPVAVVVLGHPDYYPRFGFSADLAAPLRCPFGDGEAWMAIEMRPKGLADVEGEVEYSPPFLAME